MEVGSLAREATRVVRLAATTPGIVLRVATYNVHKCRGIDGRVRPERIASVIASLDAHVIALQEIYDEQAKYHADHLKYRSCFGENRKLKTRGYGNATLSRLPFGTIKNYDLTHGTRERRGI